jgi:hypothetical protein
MDLLLESVDSRFLSSIDEAARLGGVTTHLTVPSHFLDTVP